MVRAEARTSPSMWPLMSSSPGLTIEPVILTSALMIDGPARGAAVRLTGSASSGLGGGAGCGGGASGGLPFVNMLSGPQELDGIIGLSAEVDLIVKVRASASSSRSHSAQLLADRHLG